MPQVDTYSDAPINGIELIFLPIQGNGVDLTVNGYVSCSYGTSGFYSGKIIDITFLTTTGVHGTVTYNQVMITVDTEFPVEFPAGKVFSVSPPET